MNRLRLSVLLGLFTLFTLVLAGCGAFSSSSDKSSSTSSSASSANPDTSNAKSVTTLPADFKSGIMAGAGGFNPAFLAALSLTENDGAPWSVHNNMRIDDGGGQFSTGAYRMQNSVYKSLKCAGFVSVGLNTDTVCARSYLQTLLVQLVNGKACSSSTPTPPATPADQQKWAVTLSLALPPWSTDSNKLCSLAGLAAIWNAGYPNVSNKGISVAAPHFVASVLDYYNQIQDHHLMTA